MTPAGFGVESPFPIMKLVIALTQLTSRTPPVFGGFCRHSIPCRRGQVHLFARKTSGPVEERYFYEEGDIEAFNRDMAKLNQDSRYTPYGLLAIAIAAPAKTAPEPEPNQDQHPEQPEQPEQPELVSGELPDEPSQEPEPQKRKPGRKPGSKTTTA